MERALRGLQQRCNANARPGDWRTLWAPEDVPRLADALDDLAAPLLFGGGSTLVIRHAEALPEAAQEMVLSQLDRLGSGGRLLLVAGVLDARRRLVTTCQKAGAAFAFAPLADAAVARRWIAQLARERGHAIAGPAVDELFDRVGFNLGTLDMEIEKLSVAAGAGQAIDAAAVCAVVGATRARGVEELTDRLGRGDLSGALVTFRALVADGEAPLRMLAFLAANLRRSLHVAELASTGLRAEEIGQRIGMPPWLVQKNLGRGEPGHLRRALRALRAVDLALKRSRPAEAVFEQALYGMVPKSTRTAGAR